MPPGKEGKITLSILHTEGLIGELAKGSTVTTNDPTYPTFSLVLRAFVKSLPQPQPTPVAESPRQPGVYSEAGKRVGSLSISPHDRWMTTTVRGISSTTTLYIFSHETRPVNIKAVVPGGDKFSVRSQPIQAGKRYEMVLATNPALAPGVHKQTLKVLTDSKETPELLVEMEVTVYGSVFVTPSSLTLPAITAEVDPATISLPPIYVRKIRSEGLQIKSVLSTLPFLRLKTTSEAEGLTYKIEISINKAAFPAKGEFKGSIRIETNDPDSPVIEVPIHGTMK